MMQNFAILIILSAILSYGLLVNAATSYGWTYRTEAGDSCTAVASNQCGPAFWGKVSPSCGSGSSQSPIDISSAIPADGSIGPIIADPANAACSAWTAFSTNASLEVELKDCSSQLSLTYGLGTYNALQIHIHSPSEHTIGGGYFPAEAHIVHQNPLTQDLLVLGILLDVATVAQVNNNSFFNTIWSQNADNQLQNFEAIEVQGDVAINPYGLLPGSTSRYAYSGSLTTPPCTEGVQWILFEQPVTISQKDFEAIRAASRASPKTIVNSQGDSNRVPTLPLNDRPVFRLVDANVFGTDGNINYDDDNEDGFTSEVVTGSLALAAVVVAVLAMLAVGGMAIRLYTLTPPSPSGLPEVDKEAVVKKSAKRSIYDPRISKEDN